MEEADDGAAVTAGSEYAGAAAAAAALPVGRREQRRHEREAAILDAAKQLMAEQGYDAMTMDDLAARSGISKPTLYQHFPSKQAIAIRVVVDLMRRGRTYIEALDGALPAITKLERVLHQLILERFECGKFSFGPAARAAIVPAIKADPDYQREVGAVVAALCEIVAEAKTSGDFRAHLPNRLAVQLLFSVMRDAEFEDFIARGEWSPGDVANTVVAILLYGMRSPNGGGAAG